MKLNRFTLLFISLVFIFSSCLDQKYQDIISNTIPSGFEFQTIQNCNITVKTLSTSDEPIKGVYIEIYTENPLDSSGLKKVDCTSKLIFKGITTEAGVLNCEISPATTVDSLSILINQIGLPRLKVVALTDTKIDVLVGGKPEVVQNVVANSKSSKVIAATTIEKNYTNEFFLLGSWNRSGVPNYLTSTRDIITTDLLNDINASLPESIQLPVSHPEYLESAEDGNIELIEDAEVWVTFVHEGAGYVNSLCYYTYNSVNPPTNSSEIKNPIIIFPNVSYSGSGGGLTSGDKVQLMYYNEATNSYTTIFPAGTTVSWLFRANGWNSNRRDVTGGLNTFYSDQAFNIESDVNLKKHNVILKDDARSLLLIGFEDIRRDQNSDNDFNDAVFYATVSPYTAVKTTNYKPIASNNDSDNDGVNDNIDEYPGDPKKAFNNYYPALNQTGTLAFEDLWPNKGDYDFNDLVIDYYFNQITNGQNQVAALDAQLTVRAIGASYKNGFGIQLNTDPSNVLSVSGQSFTENILDIAVNGVENSQNKAVIMAFDNAFSILKHPGSGLGVNTSKGETYQTPGVLNISIEFNSPISYSDFGTPPFNPFIFKNGQRSTEIHLPGSSPTDLADMNIFGTGDDNSKIETGKYYMSDKYLPWAINIPVKFDYPFEKQDITKTYVLFNTWANSGGFNNMDWYLDKNGYREISLIYSK